MYMMINNFNDISDEVECKLYVGITRAKKGLYIHYNNLIFDTIRAEGVLHDFDDARYSEPEKLVKQLGMRDVILDRFIGKRGMFSL